MEPKLPRPNTSPENQPANPNIQPELPSVPSVEVAPETQKTPEKTHNAAADDAALAAATQAAPAATPAVQSTPSPTKTNDDEAMPTIAGDEDRIEKEWVDKAKKVVAQTREDPHQQSHEVSKMQTDYLYKRFGKQINLPNDS